MTMTDTEAKALEAWNDVRIKRHEPVIATTSAAMICSPSAFITLCRVIEREAATEARHAAEMRELKERFSEVLVAIRRKTVPQRCHDAFDELAAPFIIPAPDPLVEAVGDALEGQKAWAGRATPQRRLLRASAPQSKPVAARSCGRLTMTDALIARLESADGPSGSLLLEAAKAVWVWDCVPTGVNPDAWVKRWNRFHRMLDAEAWTSAAEMLVPEGWHMSVNTTVGALLKGSAAVRDRDGGPSFASAASAPALALAAAALKARGV